MGACGDKKESHNIVISEEGLESIRYLLFIVGALLIMGVVGYFARDPHPRLDQKPLKSPADYDLEGMVIKNEIMVQRLQEDCVHELRWYNLVRIKGNIDATKLHNMGINLHFRIPQHLRLQPDYVRFSTKH